MDNVRWGDREGWGWKGTDFLAFDFTPLLQSWSSTVDFFAFSTAAFAFAASAFLVEALAEE